jgi:UDPglucose 6-dehydrogenase
LFERVKKYFKGNLAGKTFAIWGLSYKPETDDVREAPSLYLIDDLLAAGAKVQAYDPEAMEKVKQHYGDTPGLTLTENAYAALDGAEALLIVTEWPVFKEPDFTQMRARLHAPIIFDGRNIYSPATMREHGFYYESIGRPTVQFAYDDGKRYLSVDG